MNGTDFIEMLQQRYSCRNYTSEQLTKEELEGILESAHLSPSAKNLQPLQLCVVQSEEGLAKIDECTPCRFGAPTVVIAAYDIDVSFKLHGPDCEEFGDIDTSIALTNMANMATCMGLQSCWVGNFDPAPVREKFAVPENYRLVELMMFGHANEGEPHSGPSRGHSKRREIDEFVAYETY